MAKRTFAAALLVLGLLPALAFAAKPGGQLTSTISFNGTTLVTASSAGPTVSGPVSFHVTRSYAYDKDTIWVTNKCWDAGGNLVARKDSPVAWGASDSLEGTTTEFTTSGASCTAYVTLKPWADRPLGDALLSYSVSG